MTWVPPDAGAATVPPPRPLEQWRPVEAPGAARPRLAPMTAMEILDGGFAILRRAPATILGITAAFVVPVHAVGAWLGRGEEGLDVDAVLEQSDTTLSLGAAGVSDSAAAVLQVGPMIALVFVAAAIARLVSAWQVGHDLGTGELVRITLGRSWALLASWVLVHLLELVAVLGIVLPLAVMTWFLVTAPVIGAEGLGPVAAMRRSARLASRRFWMVLGLALLGFLVEQLFESAIGMVPILVSAVVGTEGALWVLPGVAGILTSLVTVPVVAGITVLIYLDLRVRTEGLDLELDLVDAFPSAT